MTSKKKPASASLRYLHDRLVGNDKIKAEILEEERTNTEVASLIYNLRHEAGITQQELADRINTTKSVVSRLESADYSGHSLSMLKRIASALDQKIQLSFIPKKQGRTGQSIYL